MTALPRVLGTAEFPLAELAAARLDGELFRLGPCFAPIDVAETARDRAAAVAEGIPRRFVAELGTAAWIWGATAHPPVRPRFCLATGDGGGRAAPGALLRQVAIRPAEIALLGGVRVTTPARTIVDLARSEDWDPGVAEALARLPGAEPATLAELAERTRSSAYGVRALARIRRLSPR